jgi:hypothetical protein
MCHNSVPRASQLLPSNKGKRGLKPPVKSQRNAEKGLELVPFPSLPEEEVGCQQVGLPSE